MAISRASDSSIQDGLPRFNNIWDGTTATSAFDSLGSVLVPSGGLSSITFSSIPATYTHLQIRGIARSTSSAQDRFNIKVIANNDYTENYAQHRLLGDGSSASASATVSPNFQDNNWLGGISSATGATSPAGAFGTTTIDVLDYANVNKNKVFRALAGQDQNNTSGRISLVSGLWRSTSALTSITILLESSVNFAEHSQFSLYGIK